MSGAPLLDSSGCLTEAGLDALQSAAPGRAPADVVAHLGKCGRCQGRTLARSAGYSPDALRVKKAPPPMWRTVAVVIAIALAAVSAWMMLTSVR
jgi:hypothetical protein